MELPRAVQFPIRVIIIFTYYLLYSFSQSAILA
jgi:hypothetical protein